MDSTSVAAVAQRGINQSGQNIQLEAVTVEVSDVLTDDEEGIYASYAAQHLGISHQILHGEKKQYSSTPPPRPKHISPKPGRRPKTESGDQILHLAAEKGRVILTGLGGDPILRPRYNYWLEALRDFHFYCLFNQFFNQISLTNKRPQLFMSHNLRRWRGEVRFPQEFPEWLKSDLNNRFNLRERLVWKMHKDEEHSALENMLLSPFWSQAFSNNDPVSAGFPVRTRHPFFDLRLIEYMRTVPSLPWMLHKYLLRQAMQDYLPNSILERKKTPLVGNLMQVRSKLGTIPDWYWDLATAPELEDYIDLKKMKKIVEAAKSGEAIRDHNKAITLAYWLQTLNN